MDPWVARPREIRTVTKSMKKISLSKPPTVLKNVDLFLGAVRWTGRRTVIVSYGGRQHIRIRTFHRQKEQGFWYPGPRYLTVPISCAAELGEAMILASKGEPFGPPPEWWADFQEQYADFKARRAAEKADETPDVDRSQTSASDSTTAAPQRGDRWKNPTG